MYNTKIKMTTTKLVKNPNTKTTFLTESKEVKTIKKWNYDNIVADDTIKMFRRLGGSEHVECGYFHCGYLIYKLISTSPDRQRKTIREFEFIKDKRYK